MSSGKAVWKWAMRITEYQKLSMPKGAEILSVQNQNDTIHLWALVDLPEPESESRRFVIIGTGQEHVKSKFINLNFLATVQIGILVWHVFEELEEGK